jgi:hypothetical protein
MADDPDLETEIETNEDAGASNVDIEAQARKLGWIPESEWDEGRAEAEGRRKPKHFVSAEEFIESRQNDLPVMRRTIRTLDAKIDHLTRAREEDSRRLAESGELIKTLYTRETKVAENSYRRGVADQEAKMRAAVDEGDTVAYDKAVAERNRIIQEAQVEQPKQPQPSPQPQRPTADPVIQDWLGRNSWFGSDPVLHNYMLKESQKLVNARGKAYADSEEGLEEAKARVIEKFPEEFGINTRRSAPGSVLPSNGNGRKPPSSAEQRFRALPKEDRDTYERHKKQFKAEGFDYTIERFMEGM